ncbi:uncharacterized protein MONOS_14034 [Monocercomonoides exilis]|uniref:uncharacterized protein n=1 Tax=Monocercomonoides exilis TaxID=2049356 RepID=UPI003559E738|nr:hypothetical protein MONOS_14034 [Monocercomonoides exilis]|eukprot:MONOS_14034.1-p1 / transcript=MONOS_14034.1 / gene=MONOS_14034 / organism=Monocercomonoides_exilis_PA203 / gene_product=unspecified product / transcript_product=unspecified product / location=Mono_scaffold00925:17334-17726(+) / protein_length=131 / sequence_SO=supercontig / SO=protein_coding / is_pseudo=false
MNENVELTDVVIEKVKKKQMQESVMVSVDDKRTTVVLVVTLAMPSSLASAEREMILFSSSQILPSGFCENTHEKLEATVKNCRVSKLLPNLNRKVVAVKVGSGMSVVGRRQRWGRMRWKLRNETWNQRKI